MGPSCRTTQAVDARLAAGWPVYDPRRGKAKGPRVWRQNEDVALGFWISRGERRGLFNVTWVRINDRAINMVCVSTRGLCQRPEIARAQPRFAESRLASRPRACTSGHATTPSRSTPLLLPSLPFLCSTPPPPTCQVVCLAHSVRIPSHRPLPDTVHRPTGEVGSATEAPPAAFFGAVKPASTPPRLLARGLLGVAGSLAPSPHPQPRFGPRRVARWHDGEVPPRCRRGAAEVPQRCRRGAAEVQQKCSRSAAEV